MYERRPQPPMRIRNVNIAALEPELRKKIKKMMDLFEEATDLRKDLIAAGVHVKFMKQAGLITFTRTIQNPVAINEILIEEPPKDANS